MSIIVVCPGCRKSFKVSDQFAGRSGPCPKCKRVLKVPDKNEQVQVHAPEEFSGGGRSKSGKLVIKPVAFRPAKLEALSVVIIVAIVITVLALTWLGRHLGLFSNLLAATAGLLAVSPLLTTAGYKILHDDEFEPYSGKDLYLRTSLCALGYTALWGLFTLLAARGFLGGDLWNWAYMAPPFVVIGGLFAMCAFDFDFGDGVFHYGFYLVATIVLRWIAGLKWIWDIAS